MALHRQYEDKLAELHTKAADSTGQSTATPASSVSPAHSAGKAFFPPTTPSSSPTSSVGAGVGGAAPSSLQRATSEPLRGFVRSASHSPSPLSKGGAAAESSQHGPRGTAALSPATAPKPASAAAATGREILFIALLDAVAPSVFRLASLSSLENTAFPSSLLTAFVAPSLQLQAWLSDQSAHSLPAAIAPFFSNAVRQWPSILSEASHSLGVSNDGSRSTNDTIVSLGLVLRSAAAVFEVYAAQGSSSGSNGVVGDTLESRVKTKAAALGIDIAATVQFSEVSESSQSSVSTMRPGSAPHPSSPLHGMAKAKEAGNTALKAAQFLECLFRNEGEGNEGYPAVPQALFRDGNAILGPLRCIRVFVELTGSCSLPPLSQATGSHRALMLDILHIYRDLLQILLVYRLDQCCASVLRRVCRGLRWVESEDTHGTVSAELWREMVQLLDALASFIGEHWFLRPPPSDGKTELFPVDVTRNVGQSLFLCFTEAMSLGSGVRPRRSPWATPLPSAPGTLPWDQGIGSRLGVVPPFAMELRCRRAIAEGSTEPWLVKEGSQGAQYWAGPYPGPGTEAEEVRSIWEPDTLEIGFWSRYIQGKEQGWSHTVKGSWLYRAQWVADVCCDATAAAARLVAVGGTALASMLLNLGVLSSPASSSSSSSPPSSSSGEGVGVLMNEALLCLLEQYQGVLVYMEGLGKHPKDAWPPALATACLHTLGMLGALGGPEVLEARRAGMRLHAVAVDVHSGRGALAFLSKEFSSHLAASAVSPGSTAAALQRSAAAVMHRLDRLLFRESGEEEGDTAMD